MEDKLSELDLNTLELAKSKKEVALANAKAALAQNETAELNYKYFVLQLYMKYGLTSEDSVKETGEIVRGASKESSTEEVK